MIGEHFHFTAFGIDWINQRWLDGNPPTYQEYAIMWQTEFQKRQNFASKPKQEWAYINFIQKLSSQNHAINHNDVTKLWNLERQKHKNIVKQIIDQFI